MKNRANQVQFSRVSGSTHHETEDVRQLSVEASNSNFVDQGCECDMCVTCLSGRGRRVQVHATSITASLQNLPWTVGEPAACCLPTSSAPSSGFIRMKLTIAHCGFAVVETIKFNNHLHHNPGAQVLPEIPEPTNAG